ncbi:chemotaxis protein CheA [Tritonibacter mobilis]|uniref:chemotaxis protein CheA n=1 Tax=Tritonibacter mobilis TaxID=379347 RepID=UPI003A5C0847
MVQNNKVLTVSYGTFSCTLEGFEDSFDTMKAIAEYFRDLAADDRYFGAEPPQPDAEMMARIAQREIARQVEARSGEGGIHLRAAAPATAPTAAPAPAPASVAPPAPAAPEEDQSAAPAVARTDELTPDSPRTTPEAAPQGQAAVQKEAPDAPVATVPVDVSEDVAEPEDDWAEDVPSAASAPEAEAEDTVPAADSIAAKLQRIRAVVAKAPHQDEEFIEDEHADAVETDASDLAAETTAELYEDHYDGEENADTASDEETVSDILDRLDLTGTRRKAETDDRADTAHGDTAEEPAPSQEDTEAQAEAQPSAAERPQRPRTIRVMPKCATSETEGPAEAPSDTPETASTAEATPQPASPLRLGDDTAVSVPSGEQPSNEQAASEAAPSEPVRPRRPVRGRVIRVKRAQADETLIDATAEDVTPRQRPEATPAVSTSLSEDDEAELMAELAAVEAELMASTTDTDEVPEQDETDGEDAFDDGGPAVAPAAPAAPRATERPAREILTSRGGSPDGDVSRLMAAADDRLSDEDAASSRETYNQLRAAVAAAQADPGDSDEQRREARTRAFRDDLASVVRPSRAASAEPGSGRGAATSRPAPLKLVAEQRIDPAPQENTPTMAPAAAAAPVRPRRVSSVLAASEEEDATPATRQQDGAFASYASEKGAVELHELLEAAASYMSFVEGRESFSRPQLINKVRTLDGQSDFNREDSLRFFGQLLREGKLKKASNGRFSVSSQIGFRPGNRAAG